MASFVTVNPIMAEKDEDLAVSRSSKSDTRFDTIIGHIEDIIMDDEFQALQTNFMDTFYKEFEDSEENKLCYTDIHRQYTELIEKYIGNHLSQRMTDFDMSDFQRQLISRKNELDGEIFEMLITFTDFLAFKEIMLDYKAEKEGRTIDLTSGFTVTSLGGPTNGFPAAAVGEGTDLSFGVSGASLGIVGSSAGGNHINLMDSEEAMVEGGNTPRLDCGEPSTSTMDTVSDDGKHPPSMKAVEQEHTDIAMESPRQ